MVKSFLNTIVKLKSEAADLILNKRFLFTKQSLANELTIYSPCNLPKRTQQPSPFISPIRRIFSPTTFQPKLSYMNYVSSENFSLRQIINVKLLQVIPVNPAQVYQVYQLRYYLWNLVYIYSIKVH